MTGVERRTCPDCGSDAIDVVQRGLAGRTDESNQFFRCSSCGRVTFEIISRTARDVRLEKMEAGKLIRHDGHSYRIMRVLKVGLDEYLIYVRPASPDRSSPTVGRER